MPEATHPISQTAVTVRRLPSRGMIMVRGDLAAPNLQAAVKLASGFDCPDARAAQVSGVYGVASMSHDELLLMVPSDELAVTLRRFSDAVAGGHALVADVSGARALFELSGPGWRDVLAKLVPVDMSPDAFGAGMIRRTRMAQSAAAFWMNGDVIELVCFRSVADYAHQLLTLAAQPGSEVGFL